MTKVASAQPWKDEGLTKPEWMTREVGRAVNAGKAWDVETVDFSDPNRPLTCLEVDFPIVPIDEVATIEGKGSGALKPIYQVMKWWARRRSNVFRSLLLAAAIKAPDDPAEAAKLVWNVYYGNHQKKGIFKHLKVADIFMGGGTTVVEGSRLGMQMYGNDLNPIAWFVVKNELAQVDKTEVEALLAEIEGEVKPRIMPYFTCDCPRGHKGKWTQISTGEVMGSSFDPLALTSDERQDYRYEGPEIIYTFWGKHVPCQVTDCGHRTPILTSPFMATRAVSIKSWARECKHCAGRYDVDEREVRLAPGVALVVAQTETPYAVARLNINDKPDSATCPHCGKEERFGSLGKAKNKKVELTVLIHPDWIKGESAKDAMGLPLGGAADDSVEDTVRWNHARTRSCSLVEIRGPLPDKVICPDSGTPIYTGSEGGTVTRKSMVACASCGTEQDVREAVSASRKNGPVAMYAFQGFCPTCDANGDPISGRFFEPVTNTHQFDTALQEWANRKDTDLSGYWPKDEVPFGFMTGMANGDIRTGHGFTHWWKMFNARQLLVLSQLLKGIIGIAPDKYSWSTREYIIGAFQQYLRNENMFCFWNSQRALEPHFSNNNFHPKANPVENSAFTGRGRGDWTACARFLFESLEWAESPWEVVSKSYLEAKCPEAANEVTGSSYKISTGDPLRRSNSRLSCRSATELTELGDAEFDLVITDPPFGGLLHYSELADFFHVWLRLALEQKYPDKFSSQFSPKTLEAVSNRARQPDDPDAFYQRLLTACWREAYRILKPGGILAFTFHHSEDDPWVSVLESLFDSGFYLEATYPIRSDESKGTGQFGSKMIEYDIIHVCRKRHEEPKPVSWPKLRRQILDDIRELKELLEHHQKEGLPEADLQVIRRGKALEYFSRHYGKVFKDQDTPMSVLEALLGINQLLDEEAGGIKEPPPHNGEPFTRMLLRLFDGRGDLPRDQMQKFLRGSGSAPSDFVNRGWVTEQKKVFYLVPPLEIARGWVGRQRKGMTSDYDQAMFFIGACFEGSGINASETLNNPNFLPHPALGAILTWFKTHGPDSPTRNAASLAAQLYRTWEGKNQSKAAQLTLFDTLGEEDD